MIKNGLLKFAYYSVSLCGVFLLSGSLSYGQSSQVKYEIETQAIGTTNDVVPFWLRSNQYGSIPLAGASGSFVGRAYKNYRINTADSISRKKIDFGFGFEGRANIGRGSNIQLIEAYGKLKVGIFELKGGRSKDLMGLNPINALSSGNFSISGNALGVPKIEISISDYTYIPIFKKLLSIKGSFSHGWMGTMSTNGIALQKNGLTDSTRFDLNSYLHSKSLYGRIGRDNSKLKVYAGFNHHATWGDEKKLYGELYTLSSFETFSYAVQGKSYHSKGIPGSKIGNQLGSIDAGIEYDFKKLKVTAYHQFFYDIGGLYHFSNVLDGLTGIAFTNKNFNSRTNNIFNWQDLIVEFFYSFNQGGVAGSNPTPSGPEDYYNNYLYNQGWSYRGEGLGNPFITPFKYARSEQEHKEYAYFINNRVVALHTGYQGSIYKLPIKLKLSYSVNHGLFATSAYSRVSGNKYVSRTSNIFEKVHQFSFYAETSKRLNQTTFASIAASFDKGKLLNNSTGLLFKLTKEIN